MKVKNLVIALSVCLNIALCFLLFNEAGNEGPVDVGLAFKEAVRVDNYELAKTLFAEGRNQYITDETLKKVNEIMSGGTSFHTYELLEFDNGEMVLLTLTPNGKYDIQDITIVPDELKAVFK
ncbi:hypothetical protein VBD025_16465 [Virgibacillus flavescens]|uniref:hypothetical protein n=1 Tax=Virgibacillus flavescens TaxID=1611422 RepID=UPI003D3510F8